MVPEAGQRMMEFGWVLGISLVLGACCAPSESADRVSEQVQTPTPANSSPDPKPTKLSKEAGSRVATWVLGPESRATLRRASVVGAEEDAILMRGLSGRLEVQGEDMKRAHIAIPLSVEAAKKDPAFAEIFSHKDGLYLAQYPSISLSIREFNTATSGENPHLIAGKIRVRGVDYPIGLRGKWAHSASERVFRGRSSFNLRSKGVTGEHFEPMILNGGVTLGVELRFRPGT